MGETSFYSDYANLLCSQQGPKCEDIPIDAVSTNAVKVFLSKINQLDSKINFRLPTLQELKRVLTQAEPNKKFKRYCHHEDQILPIYVERLCSGGELFSEDGKIQLLTLKKRFDQSSYSTATIGKVVDLEGFLGFSGIRFRILREIK
jgi:hypothetical protein